MDDKKILQVPEENIGERLDLFVCNSIKDISRTLIQRLIEEKQVLVNDKASKAGYKLHFNDVISIFLPSLKETNIKPEDIKLDIVFEDKDLIVINKSQGMVTHPASGVYSGTLVNALLYRCKDSLSGINGVIRPGIVHRLDKETSGLIIVCKNDKSHLNIANQIKERTLKRIYLAMVSGKLPYKSGVINKPIDRDKVQRHKMAVVPGGRVAITHWKVIKEFENYTYIECSLETGRTHQIRVHMKSLGYPILGDKTYGKKNDCAESMMLHAYKLIFTHPKNGKEIKLETEVPARFISLGV